MTLEEVLRLRLDDTNRARYNANAEGKRISEVIIDGVSIKGFSAFSFVRKLSYVTSPKRASNGSLGNIDAIAVIIMPQLEINFGLLFIDDYRKIMNLLYARREHIVQCYDIVRDTRVTEKMYFEPEELPKLFTITRELQMGNENAIELLGVQDYTIIMTGTGNPKNIININYYDMNNTIIASQSSVEHEEILIGNNANVPQVNGYNFSNKWERGYLNEDGMWTTLSNTPYLNNEAYSVALEKDEEIASKTISFKALYKDEQEHILSLNYGFGEPVKDQLLNPISVFTFTNGKTYGEVLESIGGLPASENPQIEENGTKYTTYTRLGWYKTAILGENQVSLKNADEIKPYQDTTIYQLFEPVKHNVSYVINKGSFIFDKLSDVAYNSTVATPKLPNVTENGKEYKFDGWYLDSEYKNKFGGTMKPHDITLYAKWVEQK